jgi:hypothetical protein
MFGMALKKGCRTPHAKTTRKRRESDESGDNGNNADSWLP